MISQQVFNSENNLKEPFVAVRRVNVKDTGLGANLRQTIFDYCIIKGKPLVLTGFDQLDTWDSNLFNIEYLQNEHGKQNIQVYEQYNDTSTVTVTWKDYITRLKEDSILTSKDINIKNNYNNAYDINNNNNNKDMDVDNNVNNKHTNSESTLRQQVNEQQTTNQQITEQHHQIQQQQQEDEVVIEKENLPIIQNIAEKVKLNTRNTRKKITEAIFQHDDDHHQPDHHHHRKPHHRSKRKSILHKKKLYYGKDLDCPEPYLEKMDQLIPNCLLPLGNDDLMKFMPKNLQAINLLCYLGGNGTGTPFHCDISGAIGHNLMTFADSNAYSHWLLIDKSDTEKLRCAVNENDLPVSSYKSFKSKSSGPTIINNDNHQADKKENNIPILSSSSLPSPSLSVTAITNNKSDDNSDTEKSHQAVEEKESPSISSSSVATTNSDDNENDRPIKRRRRGRPPKPKEVLSAEVDSNENIHHLNEQEENGSTLNNSTHNLENSGDIDMIDLNINDQKEEKVNLFLESERAIVTIDQLKEKNIKTYVIIQKPGDMVIVPSVCYHQVTNVGISFKVAWNRITAHSLHEGITKQLPLYKRIGRPETYRCSATIYFALKELVFNNLPVPGDEEEEEKAYFIHSYQLLVSMFYENVLSPEIIETIPSEKVSEKGIMNDFSEVDDEAQEFDVICDFCHSNIFHRYYRCDDCEIDLCLTCYGHGRTCKHPTHLFMHQTNTTAFMYYCRLYFNSIKKINTIFGPNSIHSEVTTFKTNGKDTYPLATICRRLEIHRKTNDLLCNQFYCFHCGKTFSLIQLQCQFNTNIFHIFKRRPCSLKPDNKDIEGQIDRIFTCLNCSKKCSGCQILDTVEKGKSDEVFYFNDGTRTDAWCGGLYDNGLFQSACWPNYGVMMNDDRDRLHDICKQKTWTYPEDFFNLAAAALIRKIRPFGWGVWASKKQRDIIVDLIRTKAQQWTDLERERFKHSNELTFDTQFQFNELNCDKDPLHIPLLTTMGLKMTVAEFPVIRTSLDTRGRKRKYL